jgi:hypothetical protein
MALCGPEDQANLSTIWPTPGGRPPLMGGAVFVDLESSPSPSFDLASEFARIATRLVAGLGPTRDALMIALERHGCSGAESSSSYQGFQWARFRTFVPFGGLVRSGDLMSGSLGRSALDLRQK